MVRRPWREQTLTTDINEPTAQTDSKEPAPRRRPVAFALIAVALAIVLALAGGLSLLLGGGPGPSRSLVPHPTPEPDGFPTEVLGLPVVTVGDALTLIGAGAVDGRELAVGGWWTFSIPLSCPMPIGFIPPLVGFCDNQSFASQAYQNWTCDAQGNPNGCGTGQRPPGVAEMALRTMSETVGGDLADMAAFNSFQRRGAPAVIVGHAGDPRQWQCLADDRAYCGQQFVVDRVVWLDGTSIDQVSANADPVHHMAPEEAVAAAQKDGSTIVALMLRLGDSRSIDPRFPGVGEAAVWVVRTMRSSETVAGGDPTRGVDVTLIDDATGAVLSTIGLEIAADYQPGALLIQGTERGPAANDQVFPYYRVELHDGAAIVEMRIGDGAWNSGGPVVRYGAGLPAVVEPGAYVIHAWRATAGGDAPIGAPRDECTTQVSVVALDELRLQADFPATGPCSFVTPTFETVFDP